MKAQAVIGAGYGDEGKGLITDYLVSRQAGKVTVCLSNGGAQRGHTVVTPDGERHVFHHFGAGTFAGAETFLSRFFVCNPLMFIREYGELLVKGFIPDVTADPNCMVTTPYDIMINQMVEETRGSGRHGSCGVGFGETIERNGKSVFGFTLATSFSHPHKIRRWMHDIRKFWVPRRLAVLGVEVTKKWQQRIDNPRVIDWFVNSLIEMERFCKIAPWDTYRDAESLIFEGAQGLELDQDYGKFPHVTRSNTGLKNIMELKAENSIEEIDVHYVSRCYSTRHGSGPFRDEMKPYDRIVDNTNAPNLYQGSIRFAPLDLNVLERAVRGDIKRYGDQSVSPRLAVTCLDQVDSVTFSDRGGLETVPTSELVIKSNHLTLKRIRGLDWASPCTK